MSTPPRGGMSHTEVAKVKAAVHQFLTAAESGADRTTRSYRFKYEYVMQLISRVDASGRTRKARIWRAKVRAVKFIDQKETAE